MLQQMKDEMAAASSAWSPPARSPANPPPLSIHGHYVPLGVPSPVKPSPARPSKPAPVSTDAAASAPSVKRELSARSYSAAQPDAVRRQQQWSPEADHQVLPLLLRLLTSSLPRALLLSPLPSPHPCP